MQSSGAISQVSLILMQVDDRSFFMVASCQALAAASISCLFLISSGDKNSSFFLGSWKFRWIIHVLSGKINLPQWTVPQLEELASQFYQEHHPVGRDVLRLRQTFLSAAYLLVEELLITVGTVKLMLMLIDCCWSQFLLTLHAFDTSDVERSSVSSHICLSGKHWFLQRRI